MRARHNPSSKQLMRRRRGAPKSIRDPRFRKDPYWILRNMGHPHCYAVRAVRSDPPKVILPMHATEDYDDYDQDIVYPGFTEFEICVRPELSQAVVLSLQPRASEYTVWDHIVRGFGVRVRTTGHKSYIFLSRCRPRGLKLKKITIGDVERVSLGDAREEARLHRCEAQGEQSL